MGWGGGWGGIRLGAHLKGTTPINQYIYVADTRGVLVG